MVEDLSGGLRERGAIVEMTKCIRFGEAAYWAGTVFVAKPAACAPAIEPGFENCDRRARLALLGDDLQIVKCIVYRGVD